MIYLSITCATSSLKGTVEANGSLCDGKNSLELKSLLERYARSLGRHFPDAVEEIVGVANGQTSFEVFGSDVIDWMNLAVFFNAWKLCSHELDSSDTDEHRYSSWGTVAKLIEKYTMAKLKSLQPLIQSPGVDLATLVQIVTETMAWHSIIIQSCIRSLVPSGKKKKKSGPSDNSTSPLLQAIHGSAQSLCGIIEEVTKWLKGQLNTPVAEKFDILYSYLHQGGCNEGPGNVLKVLEALVSSSTDLEHGERISMALSKWNSAEVLTKIVIGQGMELHEFLHICESKLKLLQSLRQQF
ncbi:hypothetical protein IFM89_019026 [Coptis chinensis]|uniref:Uncharacterized protein n=1 Tax=Coptis chinensis TaxID=261450 RepID=A0A835HFK5_9MAGN|nr:hypothetical protein IFM89_019026 [Coptis chinensis]